MTIDRYEAARPAPDESPARSLVGLRSMALALLVAGCTAPLPEDPTTWETDWTRTSDDRSGRLQEDIDLCKRESTKYEDDNRAKDPKRKFLKCMEALGWERERPFAGPTKPASAPSAPPVAVGTTGAADGTLQERRGSGLKEDPAMVCYRSAQAPVVDSRGTMHRETLYVQLALAVGIEFARLQAAVAGQRAYDCAGTFYDAKGAAVTVPAFPARIRGDEDAKAWKARVQDFYGSASLEPRSRRTLSPGKALLCSRWAEIRSQKKPDPSVLEAYRMLQEIGAESAYRQDRKWQTAIFAAGTAKGCPTPALPPQHDIESWFVPIQSARAFHREFRDCRLPDTSGVGGCPHSFDRPKGAGNFVNDRHVLDASGAGTQASWFVGD